MRQHKLFVILAFMFVSLLLASCEGLVVKPTPTPEPVDEASLESVINATGAVVPAQWSTLSFTTAGVIEEVLVEEGQQIQPGQSLARLQGQDALKAAVAAAELEVAQAKQAIFDLNENAMAARAAAQLRLANAEKALDKAKDRRDSKNYKRADESLIAAAKADVIMARDEFKRAQETFNAFADKPEEDINRAYAVATYEAARRKRDQAEWNLNYLQSMPDSLEVNVSEGELAVAKAELQDAQAEWDRVKDGPDNRQASLAQTRLRSAESALQAARESLDHLDLKAPFASTVSKLYVHQQEWTNPGQPALVLADLKQLRVETTDLNEIDVARINLGDPVSVTFDALPEVKIAGKVTRIGTRSAEGAGVNYPVTIELVELPAKLRWGMTAFVDIEVKK